MALMLVALPVWGATFPTAENHTLVSADANGLVTVKVAGETEGWYLVQYCQDNLRAGCGNKLAIQPSSVNASSMTFQLDMGGVRDGQVAFNFRRNCDKRWLAIPDCRVKTGASMAMGMSYFTKEIEESGGAHFVYTGSGIQPWSPIDASKWCDESVRREVPRPIVVAAPQLAPRPALKFKKLPNGTLCQEPCIQEIVQNTREIKESVGTPDPSDPPDERTLQQKARKNLQETREVHKKIGTSKRKGGTVHGTLDKIHQDVADIKRHFNIQDGQCSQCHNDGSNGNGAIKTPLPKKK